MVAVVFLLTATTMAGDLPSSFKQAAALADAQPKDRATRIYEYIDLGDYYQQKYMPIFQSCLKSTEQTDMSPFSFVAAIGADGHVLRLYVDHETKLYSCVRPTLEKDEFPHPPVAPYYMHIVMNFSN